MEDTELKNFMKELVAEWKKDPLLTEEHINKMTAGWSAGLKESLADPLNKLADELKVQNEQNKLVKTATDIINTDNYYRNFLTETQLTAPVSEQKVLGFNRMVRDMYLNHKGVPTEDSVNRLRKYRDIYKNLVQNEGTDSAGGYLVPTPTYSLLLDDLRDSGLFFSETTMIPMSAKTLKIPIVAASGHPSPSRVAENAKKPVANITFGQVSLSLEKYACLIPWSDELMEDGIVDIEAFVRSFAVDWFGIVFDNILFRGDATLNGLEDFTTTFITTSGTNFNTVTVDNLISAIGALRAVDLVGAKWYMTPQTWAHLHTKKGTTNDNYYLNPFETMGQKTLLGFPVVFTDSANAPLFTAGDTGIKYITFGNLKKVYVGVKNGMTIDIATSNVASYVDQSDSNTVHYAFQENQTVIRLEKRIDLDIPFPTRIVQIKAG